MPAQAVSLVFSVHIKLQVFLSSPCIQEALIGIWWGRGPEDWTVDQFLLVPGWSSAGKMSTALTIIMHFTGGFIQKRRRNSPEIKKLRTSQMKRLRCWPHNRVHPTGSTEGTVEIFSLSSFKNDYCSMFRALFKKKKTEILSNVLLLFHVFKLNLYHLVLL